jgi:hypothetical protein
MLNNTFVYNNLVLDHPMDFVQMVWDFFCKARAR